MLRRPAWRERSHTVLRLLERHQTLLVLGFRFLYGLRTVTPFVIGMSAVPTIRFIVLNIIGALVWAVAVGGLGFAFGHAVEAAIGLIRSTRALPASISTPESR